MARCHACKKKRHVLLVCKHCDASNCIKCNGSHICKNAFVEHKQKLQKELPSVVPKKLEEI